MEMPRVVSFVESAKGILTLFATAFGILMAIITWGSQNLVFASDLAKQGVQMQRQGVETDERLARYQQKDLENKIFLLDFKKGSGGLKPEEQALLNRYESQLREVNTDIRNLERKKEELDRK